MSEDAAEPEPLFHIVDEILGEGLESVGEYDLHPGDHLVGVTGMAVTIKILLSVMSELGLVIFLKSEGIFLVDVWNHVPLTLSRKED